MLKRNLFISFFLTQLNAGSNLPIHYLRKCRWCFCAVRWENIHCASDTEQATPEGRVPDIGRFPWFGIVQHTFYLGGKTRFAVTNGVLIHPIYAVAPAEDIARIQPERLMNNTKFIVWQSKTEKYSMDLESYYLPPEYTDGVTLASIALLQILTYGEGGSRAPVLPICLPIKGAGTFTNLFVIKMSDETGEVQKEMLKMNYVDNQECAEFYFKHKLNHKLMSPKNPLCAVSTQKRPCVWDGGAALVTRLSWGYWTLLGFSVRGPGCGAPTRFLYIHDYLQWIDEVISFVSQAIREEDQVLIFRRVSPLKLIMYSAKAKIPHDFGVCDRKLRGGVLYKDNSEILVNKNFAQGFFFMSMAQVAQVNCATVVLDVNSRTNAAVWIEHHCHRDYTGDRLGFRFRDARPRECFVYFKSVTYIEFRFYFSFKAMLEVTLYGREEVPKFIPNPYPVAESTYNWLPTYRYLRDKWFVPPTYWWWSM